MLCFSIVDSRTTAFAVMFAVSGCGGLVDRNGQGQNDNATADATHLQERGSSTADELGEFSTPPLLISANVDGTPGDGNSERPFVSADGRTVVFHSFATALVDDDGNGPSDVFLYDVSSATLSRVVSAAGLEGNGWSAAPTCSSDGQLIAFESEATNFAPDDGNGAWDIFLASQGRVSHLVSATPEGAPGNGPSEDAVLSQDGRFVVFSSEASDLVPGDTNGVADVFVRDILQETTVRVSIAPDGSEANGPSNRPDIDAVGSRIVFRSEATNLATGDENSERDTFLWERTTSQVVLLSQTADGHSGNGASGSPAISGDGKWAAFSSIATNLTSDEHQSVWQVFLVDLLSGSIDLLSKTTDGTPGNAWSQRADLSFNGRRVVFNSYSGNLDPNISTPNAGCFGVPGAASMPTASMG